ncbi:MAG: tetratricopeptide repeat protein [Brumimicrobium sp.]|nr:tetratricopeptide repeat protein [Brumimicrobium sp.]
MKALGIFIGILIFSFSTALAQSPKILDSLLQLEKSLPIGSQKVKVIRDIGVYYSTKNSTKAIEYFNKAIQVGKEINEQFYTTSTYSQLAILYNNIGNISKADDYLDILKEISLKSKKDSIQASYYHAAGLINKKRGKNEEALVFFKKNLESLKKQKSNEENIAGAYLNVANTYMVLAKYKLAIENLYNALEIFEKINNKRGMSFCYNNLGNIYHLTKEYQKSIEMAEKSIVIKKELEDENGLYNSRILIADNYISLNRIPEAIDILENCTYYYIRMELVYNLVNAYHLMARGYGMLNDTLKAILYYDFAINNSKRLDSPKLFLEFTQEKESFLGFIHTDQNNISAVSEHLKLAREQKDSLGIVNDLKLLRNYHYSQENYKEAYIYNQEYQEIYDRLFRGNLIRELEEKEALYEIEKKDNAISLLQKDKEINQAKLKQQQYVLFSSIILAILVAISAYLFINRNKIRQEMKRREEMEKIRNQIAQDLHDDVGSTLSSIQIISSLLKKQSPDNSKLSEGVDKIEGLSTNVANSIREIIWSTNPANDKIDSILTQLKKIAHEILTPSQIKFDFKEEIANGELIIDPKTRKNLLMIFRETINNARKYSKSPNVDISISQHGHTLQLIIKDFGIGFDENEITHGNGLYNLQKRAKEMNGKIDFSSEKGKGTTLNLTINIT